MEQYGYSWFLGNNQFISHRHTANSAAKIAATCSQAGTSPPGNEADCSSEWPAVDGLACLVPRTGAEAEVYDSPMRGAGSSVRSGRQNTLPESAKPKAFIAGGIEGSV
jgi:hypothetical protein